jgi:hypothetical protein
MVSWLVVCLAGHLLPRIFYRCFPREFGREKTVKDLG